MEQALLYLTDGTTTLDLLTTTSVFGIHLVSWEPAIAGYKNGGVWRESPIADGRRMADKYWENIIESMHISIKGYDADDLAARMRALRMLLENASSYWTSRYASQPVYMVARAAGETETRYAVLYDGRVSQDTNYFSQSFLQAGGQRLYENIPLSLERGHWQSLPPGEVACMVPYLPVSRSFQPDSGSDNAYVQVATTTITLDPSNINIGNDGFSVLHTGIIFNNLPIPQGASILAAHLVMAADTTDVNKTVAIKVHAEKNAFPQPFTTYANFMARTLTTHYVNWTVDSFTEPYDVNSPDLTEVIQEVIDLPTWKSGNNLAIYLRDNGSTAGAFREIAGLSNASGYHRPYLVLVWMSEEASCDDDDYATQFALLAKESRIPLSGIYVYDASATAWSENYLNTTFDGYNIGSALTTGDLIYFIIDSRVDNSGPFDNLVFPLSSINSASLTVTWEQYTGSWVALGETDYTNDLSETGIKMLFWPPSASSADFDMSSHGGTNNPGVVGYAIRARVTGGSALTGVRVNTHPYTITWPHIEIPASQIPSELPALLKLEARILSSAQYNWFLAGSRKVSRGRAFSPYLNCSDIISLTYPNYITVTLGSDTTFVDAPKVSTGRAATCSFAGTTTVASRVNFLINGDLADVYAGRYRVLVQTSSAPAGTEGRIAMTFAQAPFYTELHDLVTGETLHDLGIIDTAVLVAETNVSDMQISLQLAGTSAITLYALILFPMDEWHTQVDGNVLTYNGGKKLAIDGITYPKNYNRAALRTVADDTLNGLFISSGVSSPRVQANSRQRLYMIGNYNHAITPNDALALTPWGLMRYLGLRGKL